MTDMLQPSAPGAGRRAAAIERAGTQFDMRTNIKARPNSQGTLFQGGKPTAQHRWVRGYSPSRMAAVAGAIEQQGGGVHIGGATDAADLGLSHPHLNPHSEEHTKRLMLEPLARSTYSVPDMSRLSGGIHLRMSIPERQGEAAHYSPGEKRIVVNPQTHRGDARTQLAKADAVLMHEMGHHVDITHHALQYDSQLHQRRVQFPDQDPMEHGMRGMLEHNADANMIEHYRNDPRNQRRTGLDIRKQTYGGRGHAKAAGIGYEDPGAASRGNVQDEIARARAAFHTTRSGGPATPSLLHPGQFDTQGALF